MIKNKLRSQNTTYNQLTFCFFYSHNYYNINTTITKAKKVTKLKKLERKRE